MVSPDQLWFDGTVACSCMRLRKRKSLGFLFLSRWQRQVTPDAGLSLKLPLCRTGLRGRRGGCRGATVCGLFLTLSCRQVGKQILLH